MFSGKIKFSGLGFIILFSLLVFGCASAGKKAGPPCGHKPGMMLSRQDKAKRPVTYDVLTMRKIQEIDLDMDGQKEMIAVYASVLGVEGVKVVKTVNKKPKVIFQRYFTTPVRLKVKKGTPMLVVWETSNKGFFFWGKDKKVYVWDGKSFVPKSKKAVRGCR